DVVMHAPEKWDGVEALACAENVAGRCLSLALRDHPVLDADRRAAVGIRPARDVPRRENVRHARLESLVDHDALVLLYTKRVSELRARPNADARDDEVGGDPGAVVEYEMTRLDRLGHAAEVKHDAVLLM